MAWIYLGIGILVSAVGNALMKQSNGFENLLTGLASLGFFAVGMVLYGFAVKTLPISIAYIAWTGISILLITAIGIIYFKEVITPIAAIFICMIVTGVIGLYFVTKVS